MRLQCAICQAVQPVTTADEADEDPRTQSIRRAFRAEHVARCGVGAVAFVPHTVEATYVDPEIWNHYVAAVQPSADVTVGADGFFTRPITRDGATHHVRVCEDCWQNIPRYLDFPAGLISPESDGGNGVVPKLRPGTVDTDSPLRAAAAEHLWKALCLPCYLAAFARVYPEAPVPDLRADVVGDGAPVQPPPPTVAEAVGHVTVSRWDREVTV